MDTLRGSLDSFGLDGIVELIAMARKSGVLKVFAGRLLGRIYFKQGEIVYATTRAEDGSVTDLYKRSAPVGFIPRKERRNRAQDPDWTPPLPDLVRQQVVEVMVRLLRAEGGDFSFEADVETTAYGVEEELHLDHDEVVEEARERLTEWSDIENLVPDATTRFVLSPVLPPDQFEITLDSRSWTFLAAIGDGANVSEVAERLRIFEFPAARKFAEFVRRGLLNAGDVADEDGFIVDEAPDVLQAAVGADEAAIAVLPDPPAPTELTIATRPMAAADLGTQPLQMPVAEADSQASEAPAGGSQEVKAEAVDAEEAHAEEAQPEEAQPEEAQPEEAQPGEVQSQMVGSEESQSPTVRSEEFRSEESQHQPGESQAITVEDLYGESEDNGAGEI